MNTIQLKPTFDVSSYSGKGAVMSDWFERASSSCQRMRKFSPVPSSLGVCWNGTEILDAFGAVLTRGEVAVDDVDASEVKFSFGHDGCGKKM